MIAVSFDEKHTDAFYDYGRAFREAFSLLVARQDTDEDPQDEESAESSPNDSNTNYPIEIRRLACLSESETSQTTILAGGLLLLGVLIGIIFYYFTRRPKPDSDKSNCR